MLAGGLTSRGVYLFYSEAGKGKTTLCNRIMHSCAQRGARCLAASGEEDEDAVKARMQSTGTSHPNIHVVAAPDELTWEDIEHYGRRHRVHIVMVDSFNRVLTRTKRGHLVQDPVLLAKAIRAVVKNDRAWAPAILGISHINARGEIRGSEQLKHDVDVTLPMHPSGMAPDGGVRVKLSAKKNRLGPSNVSAYFSFSTKTHTLADVVAELESEGGAASDDEPGVVLVPHTDADTPTRVEAMVATPAEKNRARVEAIGFSQTELAVVMDALVAAGCPLDGKTVRVRVSRPKRAENDPGVALAVAVAIAAQAYGADLGKCVAFGAVSLRGATNPCGADLARATKGLLLRPQTLFCSYYAQGVTRTGPIVTLDGLDDLADHLKTLADAQRRAMLPKHLQPEPMESPTCP